MNCFAFSGFAPLPIAWAKRPAKVSRVKAQFEAEQANITLPLRGLNLYCSSSFSAWPSVSSSSWTRFEKERLSAASAPAMIFSIMKSAWTGSILKSMKSLVTDGYLSTLLISSTMLRPSLMVTSSTLYV